MRIDANLLVYAHVASFEQHKRAQAWLDEQLNGSAVVGLPWASLRRSHSLESAMPHCWARYCMA